jgi:hypothetical protein
LGYIRRRVKEIEKAGLTVNQEVVARYLLSELPPLPTGLKQVVKPIEMDPIDSDFEIPGMR